MRMILSSLLVVAISTNISSKGYSSSKDNFFNYPMPRHNPVHVALKNAQINPNQSFQISWKKINLSKRTSGKNFKALLAVCINKNPTDCINIGQTNAIDKDTLQESTRRASYSVERLGGFLARNDVKNLNLAVRLASEDGLDRNYLEFETFKLSELINNNVIVEFNDGSQIEIKLI